MDTTWLETVMKDQKNCESIYKILDIKLELADPKDENYFSTINRATLDILTVDRKKAKINVIIKTMPEGAPAAIVQENNDAFKNEIKTYTTALEQMEAIINENGFKNDIVWSKLIGYKPYDSLVLEDLSEKGYSVVSREKMFDLEHASLAASTLGCYHALSRVSLNKGQISKEDFRIYPLINVDASEESFVVLSMVTMVEEVLAKWGDKWSQIGIKLKQVTEKLDDYLRNLVKVDDTRFNVINHGDCWTCNIMFKHDPNGKPMSTKLIDFQDGHYNSFAWDLTYFMFNSIQPKIRRENRSLIILTYYDSLRECLLKYGTAEHNIPTFENINEEMDRMNYFGNILLCSMFAIMSAEVDAFDFEKSIDSSSEGINKTIYSSANYINNIKDDLIDFVKTL